MHHDTDQPLQPQPHRPRRKSRGGVIIEHRHDQQIGDYRRYIVRRGRETAKGGK